MSKGLDNGTDGATDENGLFTDEDSGDQVWYTGIYFAEVTRLDHKRQREGV